MHGLQPTVLPRASVRTGLRHVVINAELTPIPAEPGDAGSGRGCSLHAGCSGSGGMEEDQVTWQAAVSGSAGHWAPLVLALTPWQGFSLCPPVDETCPPWGRSSSVQLI